MRQIREDYEREDILLLREMNCSSAAAPRIEDDLDSNRFPAAIVPKVGSRLAVDLRHYPAGGRTGPPGPAGKGAEVAGGPTTPASHRRSQSDPVFPESTSWQVRGPGRIQCPTPSALSVAVASELTDACGSTLKFAPLQFGRSCMVMACSRRRAAIRNDDRMSVRPPGPAFS